MREPSDALVIFGITGDLAYKKIFPALQALVRRGRLNVPVIGVAARERSTSWSSGRAQPRRRRQFRSRVIREARGSVSARLRRLQRREHLSSQLRQALGNARRPLYYLAIPPTAFPAVIHHLTSSGCCTAGARVIVEKPFGRDLQSARELNATLRAVFSEDVDLPHRPLPRQGGGAEHPVLQIRERVPRADLESPLRRSRPDHHGRAHRGCRTRHFLRRDRRHSRRHPESPAADRQLPGDGGAVIDLDRSRARRAGQGAEDSEAVVDSGSRDRSVSWLSDEPQVAPDSQVPTFAAMRLFVDSWRWHGVPFYVRAGKCLQATATEIIVNLKEAPPVVFRETPHGDNYVRFTLAPNVAIDIGASTKRPGEGMNGEPVTLSVVVDSHRGKASTRTVRTTARRCDESATPRCSLVRMSSKRLGRSSIRC